MRQYREVFAWKCLKCGRVLTTEGGRRRHTEKCEYIAPVLDGQMSFEDTTEMRVETEAQK